MCADGGWLVGGGGVGVGILAQHTGSTILHLALMAACLTALILSCQCCHFV